ncbi:Rieske 2Fe-2S domain-containing protein [Flavivirga algicola]|uniref:Rieske 2Fe-2S domain-containing protein n=1 Tax=Flavivirga algicola TaxID=2729136 RepID=A0ABX1RU59_9FLAO|nr:Rieske 2Fe-2S domain-containing protein [Flavivirga algicola]NMH86540.1 Rieske 2Fe-2S domain-containing protein [Flavivirga algicola]
MDKYNTWYPVSLISKLKKSPQGLVLQGYPIVIYKGKSGWVVQKDSCPHRNYPLSAGKLVNNELRCGYHGWRFDEKGFTTVIPGLKSGYKGKCSVLTTYSSYEHNGLLWVCLTPNMSFRSVSKPLPDRKIYSYRTTIKGDPADILENFLDPMHTSFLHDGLIRKSTKPNKTIAEIRAINNGVQVKYTEESHQSGIIGSVFGRFITHSYGILSKGNIIDLEFHSKKGLEMTNRFIIVPTKPGENYFFSQITTSNRWLPSWTKVAVLGPFFYLALQQDKKAIELLSNNKKTIEQSPLQSTYLDIMRRYIEKMLDGEDFNVVEKDIELYL